MLVVPDRPKWPHLIAPLESLGYVYWADHPNHARMFFVKGMPPHGKKRTHHVHVRAPEDAEAALLFRNYLRAHPETAARYGELKRSLAAVLSPLRDADKWIRRKLRCYQWKQWGRAGYRELRRRGVTVREAWNLSKSAHGPWRLSKTPALTLALLARYFSGLGLPNLAAR